MAVPGCIAVFDLPGNVPMKRAVLVGINTYTYFNELEGCENDARTMDELLREQFGFESTRLLLNTDATRENILGAFNQLVSESKADDVALIYYAGHGSQIRDLEGDEPSGFDSTLIPVDSARDNARPELMREITDDEIFLFLQRLGNRTKAITVIVDACHSGTITRDVEDSTGLDRVRGVPPDMRVLTTPSPIPPELWPLLRGEAGGNEVGSAVANAVASTDGNPVSSAVGNALGNAVGSAVGSIAVGSSSAVGSSAAGSEVGNVASETWVPVRDHYVMISGSRDTELSGELVLNNDDGTTTHHGVLTYWLTQALMEAQSGATYRSVYETVAPSVATFRQGKQHPQIEGRIDRELFGMKEIPPMRHVRVSSVAADKNSITLAAGAAIGFTAGTVVALFAPGTVNTEGQTPLAVADVTELRALDSTALIRGEGRTGDITESVRAVVQSVGLSDPRRTVQVVLDSKCGVPPDLVEKLKAALAQSAILRIVETPSLDTLSVRAWRAADAQSEARWAVTGADGTPVAPLKALADVTSVVRNLEILARQSLALALANGDAGSALGRARPTVQLLYRLGTEPFRVATPGAVGLPEFEESTQIGVRITNNHTAPVYLSLLDFGLSGKVTPMYPPKGASEPLAAAASIDLLVRDGEQWEFWLPEIYPYAADGSLPVRDDGIETIKLFATSSPASFEFLEEEEGVRSAGDSISNIEMFFRQRTGAVPHAATREGRPVATPAPLLDDWTTVIAPFVMRRKDTARMPANITRLLAAENCVVQQSLPVTTATAANSATVVVGSPNAGFGQLLLSVMTDGSATWQLPDVSTSNASRQQYTLTPSPALHSRAVFVFPLDANGSMATSTMAALNALQSSSVEARLPPPPLPPPPLPSALTGRN